MDDVDAAVEEHKEQGRLTKWWNGVTSSKSGQAFSNHSAVKALTYVSNLSNLPPGDCVESFEHVQLHENIDSSKIFISRAACAGVRSPCVHSLPVISNV